MEYVRVAEEFPLPAAPVWREIGDFGGIARWIEGVSTCHVQGEGVGCIRTVTIGTGRQVRERLALRDEAGRRIGYEVLPPHSLPARDVRAILEVIELAADRTRVVWRSQATIESEGSVMADAVGHFYRASLTNLKALLGSSL